jgi:tRNA threonylcarbamoyladenosine biosynthesis protein TsaB
MTLLAFDTCFGACSVAVSVAGGGTTVEHFEAMDKGHSERLVPMIAAALAAAGTTIAAVRTIVVTVGPGSFTGVRTGIAVARALALAGAIEVRGTTSLHVLAADLRNDAVPQVPLAIAIATRDGLIYFQAFSGALPTPTISACLVTPADAAAMLGATPHVLAGTGAALIAAVAPGHPVHNRALDVRAAHLARLAGRLPVLVAPKPLYLREPDAKPQAVAAFAPVSMRM